MKRFKIEVDEQVSIWQRVTCWVEAKNESDLRRQLNNDALNIVDTCEVDDFPETMAHMEYDKSDSYFRILSTENK